LAYTQALGNAGITGAEVDWLNAHGAGTRQGDAAEIEMLTTYLPNARLFSIKRLIGHAHGAAGALSYAVFSVSFVC
jgi:3-oxoacyl-[acyl-carrier-protein] synthase II